MIVPMIQDIIVIFFISLGTFLIILGGIGIVRMPDLYLRMSATTKVSTIGVIAILLGVMVHFWDLSVTAQAAVTIGFLLLTAPVGAHIIGRAALHRQRVELYKDTFIDDFEGEKAFGHTHDGDRASPVR